MQSRGSDWWALRVGLCDEARSDPLPLRETTNGLLKTTTRARRDHLADRRGGDILLVTSVHTYGRPRSSRLDRELGLPLAQCFVHPDLVRHVAQTYVPFYVTYCRRIR